MTAITDVRVGQGFDVHRFCDDESRRLVLGGVVFDGERPLAGHSDADVPAHAVADALLAAADLGDLGALFPDDDPQWADANSIGLLTEVSSRVRAAGWRVSNVSAAVICERPRLAPHRATMAVNLSAAAGGPVTVTGRRAEGLGAIGRVEGIACIASAVIVR